MFFPKIELANNTEEIQSVISVLNTYRYEEKIKKKNSEVRAKMQRNIDYIEEIKYLMLIQRIKESSRNNTP